MSSLNKVMLIGNLGKDPEIKETGSGKLFAKLSLATSEKYQGETKTTWHPIVVWDEKKAEVLEQYCKKGSKLFIEGKLEVRKWEDKDGVERWTTEIVVGNYDAMRMLDSAKKRDEEGEDDDEPAERKRAAKPAKSAARRVKDEKEERARKDYERTKELDDEVPW